MEQLSVNKIKLLIIARSNIDAHDFCDKHNIKFSIVKVIKSPRDLIGVQCVKYVIVNPVPRDYHWNLRPKLILSNYINLTRYYLKRELNN